MYGRALIFMDFYPSGLKLFNIYQAVNLKNCRIFAPLMITCT